MWKRLGTFFYPHNKSCRIWHEPKCKFVINDSVRPKRNEFDSRLLAKYSQICSSMKKRMLSTFFDLIHSLDVLSYSIASGIPVTLTRVKCWNIIHQSHIRYNIYKIYHFDYEVHEIIYVYDSDDWYFSTWQLPMPLEFHCQLSSWVGLLIFWKVMEL